MSSNIDLQIKRHYNGVINCINNAGCNPKSLETTLFNLKDFYKITNDDYFNFYNLAVNNNRADLVFSLLKVMNKIVKIDVNENAIYNIIFNSICRKKSNYLRHFLNTDWIDKVNIEIIYKILKHKINYGLLNRDDHMLTEYQRQDLFLNQNLKYAQEKIITHQKGASIILEIEKIYKINPIISNYWHSTNLILKRRKQKRTNARWTLIFFFSKYVKNGIHNWLWMPGSGFMFKKGQKSFNENIEN
jgi:hypothetical protein